MIKPTQKNTNRDKLLDKGMALLMAQGYHGTGLKEILDEAQIPKGSFYNYFASKEEFAAAVIQHYIEPYIDQLGRHMQNPELDALGALSRYFTESIVELEQNGLKGGCLLGNLTGEIGDTSEVCRKALKWAFNRYRDVLESGLAQAQRQGAVRTDIPAHILADLLANAWQGALLRMKIEQSSAPLKQCCDALLGDYFKA